MKHNHQVHMKGSKQKKVIIKDQEVFETDQIFDKEGLDVSEWLLQEKKRFIVVKDEKGN